MRFDRVVLEGRIRQILERRGHLMWGTATKGNYPTYVLEELKHLRGELESAMREWTAAAKEDECQL